MHAVLKDDRIFIFDSFAYKESIKEIVGRTWNPDEKAWSVPANEKSIETLDLLGCAFSEDLTNLKNRITVSKTNSIDILFPAPLKVKPYEHQLKGYNLACRSMGIIGNSQDAPGYAFLMEMDAVKVSHLSP